MNKLLLFIDIAKYTRAAKGTLITTSRMQLINAWLFFFRSEIESGFLGKIGL